MPSSANPDAASLVKRWRADRYGSGAWGDETGGLLDDESPWPAELGRQIAAHPGNRLLEWIFEAAEACIGYCVERFGQFPVTYDPLLAGFGTVVHHVDPAFYQRRRPGYLTAAILGHDAAWH